jgi:aspartate carbamoyltransferase catalytic subunit
MHIKKNNLKYHQYTEIQEAIEKVDILYMTRVQRERFLDIQDYEKVKNAYILEQSMLENSKPNLKILHPLPRVNEIHTNVDDTEQAYYFQQAQNGLYVRQAILNKVLM